MEQKQPSALKLPTVSVVIPAFNEEKYLPHALESLKKQTLYDFELIVVDNNSSDNTATIAKQYNAKVVHEEKQGYVYALNAGLKEAKGEVVAVMDADTLAMPDWLSTIAQLFSDVSIAAATGGIRTSKTFSLKNAFIDWAYALFLQVNFLVGKPHLVGFNFAIRKEILAHVGGLDIHYTMSPDVDLGLRVKKYGRVVFSPKMLVLASTRRFHKNVIQTLLDYAKSYWYAAWLRKPPPVRQVAVR